jgi:hypothetical protein
MLLSTPSSPHAATPKSPAHPLRTSSGPPTLTARSASLSAQASKTSARQRLLIDAQHVAGTDDARPVWDSRKSLTAIRRRGRPCRMAWGTVKLSTTEMYPQQVQEGEGLSGMGSSREPPLPLGARREFGTAGRGRNPGWGATEAPNGKDDTPRGGSKNGFLGEEDRGGKRRWHAVVADQDVAVFGGSGMALTGSTLATTTNRTNLQSFSQLGTQTQSDVQGALRAASWAVTTVGGDSSDRSISLLNEVPLHSPRTGAFASDSSGPCSASIARKYMQGGIEQVPADPGVLSVVQGAAGGKCGGGQRGSCSYIQQGAGHLLVAQPAALSEVTMSSLSQVHSCPGCTAHERVLAATCAWLLHQRCTVRHMFHAPSLLLQNSSDSGAPLLQAPAETSLSTHPVTEATQHAAVPGAASTTAGLPHPRECNMTPSIATSGDGSAGVGGGDEQPVRYDTLSLPQAIVPQPQNGTQPLQAPSWPTHLHCSVEPLLGCLQTPLELGNDAKVERSHLLQSRHCPHQRPHSPLRGCALHDSPRCPILNPKVNAHSASNARSNALPVAADGAPASFHIMERADALSMSAHRNVQIVEHLDRSYHLIDHISLSTQQLQDIVSGEGDKQNVQPGFAAAVELPAEIQPLLSSSAPLIPGAPTQLLSSLHRLLKPDKQDVLPPRAWSPLEAYWRDGAQERMEHLPLEDACAVEGKSVRREYQEHQHWPDAINDHAVEAQHVDQRAGSANEAWKPAEYGMQRECGHGALATTRDGTSLGTASGSEKLGHIEMVAGKLAPQVAGRSQRSAAHGHRPMKAQHLTTSAAGLERSRQAGLLTRGMGRPQEVAYSGGDEEGLDRSSCMQKRMEQFEASLSGLRSIHLQVPVHTTHCRMAMGLCIGHCFCRSTTHILDRITSTLTLLIQLQAMQSAAIAAYTMRTSGEAGSLTRRPWHGP